MKRNKTFNVYFKMCIIKAGKQIEHSQTAHNLSLKLFHVAENVKFFQEGLWEDFEFFYCFEAWNVVQTLLKGAMKSV